MRTPPRKVRRLRPSLFRFESIGPASVLVPMLPPASVEAAAILVAATPDAQGYDAAESLDRIFAELPRVAMNDGDAPASWGGSATPAVSIAMPPASPAVALPALGDSGGSSAAPNYLAVQSSSGAQPYYSGGSGSAQATAGPSAAPTAPVQGGGDGSGQGMFAMDATPVSAGPGGGPSDPGSGPGAPGTGGDGGTVPGGPINPTGPTGGDPVYPPTQLPLLVTSTAPVPVYGAQGGPGSEELQGTFTISRNPYFPDYGQALNVQALWEGDAVNGLDYPVSWPGSQAGTFATDPYLAAGQESTTGTVTVLADRGRVDSEDIHLHADAPVFFPGGDGYGSGAIDFIGDSYMTLPPTPLVTVAATTKEATEGDPTPGVFAIKRTGDDTYPLAVAYAVGGSAVAGADYQPLSGQAIIPAGQDELDVPVTPARAASTQGDVSVSLAVQGIPDLHDAGDGSPDSDGDYQDTTASVTIYDGIPQISIVATQPNASEDGVVPGTFQVTRDGSLSDPMTVAYTVLGTAVAGYDYEALPGSVVIPVGSASAEIPVTPIDNSRADGGDLTMTVELNQAPGVAISGDGDATITIDTYKGTSQNDDHRVVEGFLYDGYILTQGPYVERTFTEYESLYFGSIGLGGPTLPHQVTLGGSTQPQYGTLSITDVTSTPENEPYWSLFNEEGTWKYTPNPDFYQGTDAFSITLNYNGESVTQLYTIIEDDKGSVNIAVTGTPNVIIDDDFSEKLVDPNNKDRYLSDLNPNPATDRPSIKPDDPFLKSATITIGPNGRTGTLHWTIPTNMLVWWQQDGQWVQVADTNSFAATGNPINLLIEGIGIGSGELAASFTPQGGEIGSDNETLSVYRLSRNFFL